MNDNELKIYFVRMVNRLDLRLDRMEQLLLPKGKLNDVSVVEDITNTILQTKHELEEFDNKLNDEGFMRKVRVQLTMLGGNDIKKCFRAIFNHLFTSKLLSQYSWRGTADKGRFQDLVNIKICITKAIKVNQPAVTLKDYDNFCKDFLRFAKYRK